METKWIWAATTLLLGVLAAFGAGVARAAPLGSITEFSGGAPCIVAPLAPVCSGSLYAGGSPRSIAAGPDGNLWFNDQGATVKAIGRITPAGAITEFSGGPRCSSSAPVVPVCSGSLYAGSKPGDIVGGPDGSLWFADKGTIPAIGKITQSGTITEFSTGGLTAGPHRIAVGADGNVWFSDDSTPAIGRITPSGVITEFPVTVTSTSAAVTVADLTPPVLSLPGPIAVDATGPNGAAVSYSASATDNVDPGPVVSCTPASGVTFPIGTTTVGCTATDASGNVAHGSFSVKVAGAAAQLADLEAAVEGVGPGGILALTVAGAQSQLAHGHPGVACLALALFKVDVRLFALLHLVGATQSASFVAQADTIGKVLGC